MKNSIKIENHFDALNKNYVLLLTSNQIERAAVNKLFRAISDADIKRDTKGCNIGFIGDRIAIHISGESGISKKLSIGRIAESLLSDGRFPKPALVLLVGFCWGNPNKAPISSVIVSPRVLSLNKVMETSGGREYLPCPFESSLELTPAIVLALGESLARMHIPMLVGQMGSMETLYKSTPSRDALIKEFPDLLGAEMEAFALLPMAPPWLVVKCVSDLGDDDFHREQQKDAARRAAEAVRQLIIMLGNAGSLPVTDRGRSWSLLEDIITGNVLKVEASELAGNELNDLLNDVIGPQLVHKLGRYVSAIEYDSEFPPLIGAAILEVMQNALKHGRANHTTVTLHPTKIIIEDDGAAFDPTTLTGSKGGARDWSIIRGRYLEKNEVELSVISGPKNTGNRYIFLLPKASNVLRDAKKNCSMRTAPLTIGATYGSRSALTYDETCKVLYYRAQNLLMTSRRISVASAIRDAAASGRKVYVGCPTERDAVFFREELKEYLDDNVVVFVDVAD